MSDKNKNTDYPIPWWTPILTFLIKNPITSPLVLFILTRSGLSLKADPQKELAMMPLSAGKLFRAGKRDKAYTLAEKMLDMVPEEPDEFGDVSAIHVGNLLLGERALEQDDLESAESHLLAAADIKAYPYAAGYHGPSFKLADKLLERGRDEAVLKYLKNCKRFWPSGADVLKDWSNEIKLGKKISMAEEQQRWVDRDKELKE